MSTQAPLLPIFKKYFEKDPTIAAQALETIGSGQAVAAAFYGGVLTVLGVLINIMWRYAAHGHRLLDVDITPEKVRRISRYFLIGPTGYVIATLAALVYPPAALGVFLVLNVFYLWPRRRVVV